ncbi:IS481 family transposase [Demequina lutea]|uniref:Transposase InsO family protein n=1 Tax=Demequina lutea TaxID=431489 RepID=A0A7Z0CJQ3_9MICO|nr:IS481 family transposase [Demequina lutea]NYI41128.1 transposase InsO family protein [Demequina lutea]
MSQRVKNEVMVLAIVEGGLSVADAAVRFGVSKRWLRVLLARYREQGIEAVAPRSKAPRTSPTRVDDTLRHAIVAERDRLTAAGLDAGAESILDRMNASGLTVPSRATIHRILAATDRVTPQPHKRPRSSWTRFEAALPNETWQSDMTHWRLDDTTGVEIITWLDDHSRMIMHISAHQVVTAKTVVDTFTAAAERHGLPASTLTDNGRIFTARFATGTPGLGQFEQLIHDLGIRQKNGHPGHPQTQGKIERFHQTLKRWLTARPAADTLTALQNQLDQFTHVYNHERPHRAIGRRTPATVHAATPPAAPSINVAGHHYRIRFDHIDASGVITLRHAGQLRHLGIGRTHKHRPVIVLTNGPHTITIDRTTSEILAEHTINPDKDYQPRKPQKAPPEGEAPVNDALRHHIRRGDRI